ncbi:MAG: S-layer homology domain-containing protein [Clostridia bacterium]|nr:S-layer homology domain-containing protein [Clostridia bacterium]
MKHKAKRLLSIFLALALVMGIAPVVSQTAQAAENTGGKAIVLSADVLVGPEEKTTNEGKYYTPNSYVWFGVNGAAENPIKWRVLDAEKANDGETAGAFLLSEYLLADGVYFQEKVHIHSDGKYYKGDGVGVNHDDCVLANVYKGSDGQAWCSTFASNKSNFTPTEQSAMLGVDKTDAKTEAEERLYSLSWEESELKKEKDKIFFLSVRELAKYVGNYDKAPGLTASFDDGGSAGVWWLRSPNADHTYDAGAVLADGGRVSSYIYVYYDYAARPAFNLNLDSVLFSSAAAGGKEAGASGLAPVEPYAGSEWKLTLKDTANRSAFLAAVTAVDGEKLTVAWCGAETGENEFLSAVIKDNASGALTHYGRLAELKAESDKYGTREIDLSGIEMTDKTLCVFNEQYNGEKKTDYASKLVELPTDAPNAYPVELSVRGFTVLNYWNAVKPNDLTIMMYLKLNPGYYMDLGCNTLQVEIGENVYGEEALYQAAGDPDLFFVFVDVYDPANPDGGFSGKVKITYTAQPIPYDITYELNGGTNNENNPKTYTVEDTIPLAAPERSGYTFGGWYDNAEFSGDAVTEIPANSTGNKTFWAKWTRNSSGGGIVTPSYPVTLQQPDEGGTVTTNPTSARPGAVVTVTPQPEEGYEVDTVTVTDGSGKEISVTKNGDGTFTFTMPGGKVTVTATFKEAAHDCPSAKFIDVDENAWYHEYVNYVVEHGLMNGISADKFAPSMTTTRAMIVTILYRLEGEPAVTDANPFDDVKDGQWYTDAIIWAAENGIVEGYGNGKFGTADSITREQFAAILYRYAKYKGYDVSVGQDTNILSYDDAFDVSEWAMEAMQWACGAGLIQGDNNGALRPKSEATRAEAAAILMRFIENVK